MMNKLAIVIMTYKRKNFKAMNLIEQNQDLMFYLAVRKDELENGFYNEPQFEKQNIMFLPLTNVHDAGDTRQRINEEIYKRGYDYVFVLDDTVENIYDKSNKQKSLSDILDETIQYIKSDIYSDKIAGFVFHKRFVRKKYCSFLCQAIILNLNLLLKYGIQYYKISECGFDDFTITFDILKKGLYILNHKDFKRKSKGTGPLHAIPGGTHIDESFDVNNLINRFNERNKKTYDFNYSRHGKHNLYYREGTTKNKLTGEKLKYEFVSYYFPEIENLTKSKKVKK